MAYLHGLDEPPDDLAEQSEHSILLTTRLVHSMTERMEAAAELIQGHRDRLLDHPDQCDLDELVLHLQEDAATLSILAIDEDAKRPIAGHRMWRR